MCRLSVSAIRMHRIPAREATDVGGEQPTSANQLFHLSNVINVVALVRAAERNMAGGLQLADVETVETRYSLVEHKCTGCIIRKTGLNLC
jgi:hypothetical protein